MAQFFKHFGKIDYWEEQYDQDKSHFEWSQPYKGIRDVITQYIPKEGAKILYPGCGTSKVPEYLYNEGFKFIISIDHSKRVVNHMTSLYPKMPNTFQFMIMEAMDMDFGDEIFTTVLDKGLLDSISSGYRSVQNIKKYLQEVWRVMECESKFILISHDKNRKNDFLTKAGLEWDSIEVHQIYKRTYERESDLIREEFVSKDVLDKIENLKRVEIDFGVENLQDEVPADPIIVPFEDMPPFEPKKKEPPVLHAEGASQPDIPAHYIYICTKKVKKSHITNENDVIEEEDEDKPKNNYY